MPARPVLSGLILPRTWALALITALGIASTTTSTRCLPPLSTLLAFSSLT